MIGADHALFTCPGFGTRVRRWAILAGVVFGVSLTASESLAQGQIATGPEHVYLQPGQPAMNVYILGDVARPGKWRVTAGAELFDLLSVATPAGTGGAVGAGSRVDIEVFRTSGSTRTLVYEGSLDPLITSSDATMSLQEGDVVRVKLFTKRSFNVFQAVQITTQVASLVLLIVNLTSGN